MTLNEDREYEEEEKEYEADELEEAFSDSSLDYDDDYDATAVVQPPSFIIPI